MVALPGFEELITAADRLQNPISVAAVGAADATVLAALAQAAARGWVAPVLVGAEAEIRQVAAREQIEISSFRIVDTADPASAAVAEVRSGRARLLMKGQIDTPALLGAILSSERGLRTEHTICQVVLVEILDQARRFLLADTGITIQPTLEQKADILKSLIDTAHGLGVEIPRIALVAATEKETPAMPDTLESAALVRRSATGEFSEAIVQGPLSFDLAYAADAGEKKQIGGSVVGAADALLFPNLLAANLTVKAIMYTAKCRFGGVLRGAACPVVFMSRADTVETRLSSLALALRLAGS